MYGIKTHPQYAMVENVRQRLDSLKGDNKKLEQVFQKLNEVEKQNTENHGKYEELKELMNDFSLKIEELNAEIKKLTGLDDELDEVTLYLYGDKNMEESDVKTKEDELKRNGFIENVNKTFAEIRSEYVELIENYIGNATPRQNFENLEQLEKRIKKLEDERQPAVAKIPKFDRVKK